MDTAIIKQFVHQVEDSLPRGKIFAIQYVYDETRTDFFFQDIRDKIQFISDKRNEAIPTAISRRPDGTVVRGEEVYNDILESFKRDLRLPPEMKVFTDYSVDGVGFNVKEEATWPKSSKSVKTNHPIIYVSDGKIKGEFYHDREGVIQPATERPDTVKYWTDLAYQCQYHTLSSLFDEVPALKMEREDGLIVISGNYAYREGSNLVRQLRVDPATLLPRDYSELAYEKGNLIGKNTKQWTFREMGGLVVPQSTVEQVYQAGTLDQLHGKFDLQLAGQTEFTITSFSLHPTSAKQEFAALLKSNYSIYDKITGSHYISGDAGQMLDKLSK